MAVLQDWRGQGVGKSLLRTLIEKARNLGLTDVIANAQLTALGFYEKFGFTQDGEVFIEAGIPHRAMRLRLKPHDKPVRPALKARVSSVQPMRLETVEAALSATLQLVMQSQRQLCIFSRDLEYSVYGQNEIIVALKRFALSNRNGSVRIIIQEPANLQGQTHPVLELAQRLPSYFLIRTPMEAEDIEYLSAFVINDCDGYLFRPLASLHNGHWSPTFPAQNRQLREEFERVWQRSGLCTEFRALGL